MESLTHTTSPTPIVVVQVRPQPDKNDERNSVCAVRHRPTSDNEMGVVDVYRPCKGLRTQDVLMVCRLGQSRAFSTDWIVQPSAYKVNAVFDAQSSTESIFKRFIADLLAIVHSGGIGTLFAYGQTGSGKTHTIGQLTKLVIQDIFKDCKEIPEVRITCIELAGKSTYDLLNSQNRISVREDQEGNTKIVGACELLVHTHDEAVQLLEGAVALRSTASTSANATSSRSHSIHQLRITRSADKSSGLLYLVDLAGSEHASDMAMHGEDRMRETKDIHISLSALKDCIRSSANGSKTGGSHLPYRRSTLTRILKHVFEGVSTRPRRTVVLACIHPSLSNVGATTSTMQYAQILCKMVSSSRFMKNQHN